MKTRERGRPQRRKGPRPSRANARGRRRVSLERALSKLGFASRTEARKLIEAGRVTVNGRPAGDPLAPVVPETARISIDGAERRAPAPVVIALHKPRGVVTTRSDPEGRPTVYSLLEGLGTHVVPIGRLDLATSGLLLLTNDTRFADWLADPSSGVPRVYLVTARGRVTDEDIARLTGGVESRGERLAATAATLRKASARESHVVVTLTEGRNREVRRLFEAIGHEVARLRRVQIGGLELGTLAPRTWRIVGEDELERAFPARRAHPNSAAPSQR